MTKIYDLIYLNNQMHAVDKEAEIKIGECGIHKDDKYREEFPWVKNQVVRCTESNCHFIQEWWVKIIATTDNSLGLPLLPEIDNGVEWEVFKTFPNTTYTGVKAAKAKKYTDEDIMKFYKHVKTHTFAEAMAVINPLLPEIEYDIKFEIDTLQMIQDKYPYIKRRIEAGWELLRDEPDLPNPDNKEGSNYRILSFKKEAKAKKYTEEDIRKAFDEGVRATLKRLEDIDKQFYEGKPQTVNTKIEFEKLLSSLKTLPTHVELEMEAYNKHRSKDHNGNIVTCDFRPRVKDGFVIVKNWL